MDLYAILKPLIPYLQWLDFFLAKQQSEIPPKPESVGEEDDESKFGYTPSVEDFCGAIRDFEGKPGDLNFRNNNPGNCRCSSVGYAAKYGTVRCVGGFAVFPTYELGWEYLIALVRGRIVKHPDWDILQFTSNYAPAADHNNPHAYAQHIANTLGVEITFKIKNLV